MGIKTELKNHRVYSRYKIMKKFFDIMGMKPIHIILPAALSFLSAAFAGMSLGLMVPLAKGIAANSFDFIKDIYGLKQIMSALPGIFLDTTTPNKNAFLLLIALIFLATVAKNGIGYINQVLSAYWHGIFNRNMYKYIFERLLSFGKMFFDRTSQGYVNMIINYLSYVITCLKLFENSVNNFFTLTVYFVVMFAISWKLSAITLLVFPILYYSLKIIIAEIRKIAAQKNIAWKELYRKAFNILTCIPLIKAYSKEEETKRDYYRINEDIRRLDFKIEKAGKLIEPIQEIIVTVFLLLMVSIVALLLAKDKPAEISMFVVFFYAARRTLPMFNIFTEIKAQFAQAKPPLKEIAKLFDDTDKFFVAEGCDTFKGLKNSVEFKRLDYSYIKEKPVLKDINLFIEKGKITALVGPSGAGKTTIANLIMRFYDCPKGSILIDGTDIRNYTLKSVRSHMALVSQEALILNDTLRNNITFGLDRKVGDRELIDVSKKARLHDFIEGLPEGFDTEVGDRGVKLSGGEKQRVAIARALLKGSEIMILDEATSSLDSKTEKLIQEAIDEAVKGRTAVVIAHRLSTIKNADKIIVIENGRLIEEGALRELLDKKGKFYEYWEAQKFY